MFLGQQASGDFDVTADMMRLWAPALLQHYGPGSSYLDVSANIDIGLWFALYQYHSHPFFTPAGDGLKRRLECSWYTEYPQPWPSGDGPVIYALDAPSWDGKGVPSHGEVIDLLALGTGRLPEEALRLHKQNASLVYADANSPNGPNLDGELRAIIRLDDDFDRSSVPSWGRPCAEVFPPPGSDPFYKILLEIPARLSLESACVSHPLSIPCYLVNTPPALLSLSELSSVPDEITQYASLGEAVHPTFCHQFLLSNAAAEPGGPVDTGERKFCFKDATPFVLEAPLWLILPSVKTDEELGDWIPSALPLGIAPQLAGRPTDSIYIELSGLDHFYPLREQPAKTDETFVRAMWLVHEGNRYICTVYAVTSGELFSYRMEFRFFPQVGNFVRVPWPKEGDKPDESFRSLVFMAQKSLFLTLTVLRDLSPGFKPPPTFASTLINDQGRLERILGSLLDPQAGQAKSVSSTPYLIPKAMNGTAYSRSSGAPQNASDFWRSAPEGFETLVDAFQRVRDPWYLMECGIELGEWYGRQGKNDEGLQAVRFAIANAQSLPESNLARSMEADLEVLQGRLLYPHDRTNACQAFDRAILIRKAQGNDRAYQEVVKLRGRLCGAS